MTFAKASYQPNCPEKTNLIADGIIQFLVSSIHTWLAVKKTAIVLSVSSNEFASESNYEENDKGSYIEISLPDLLTMIANLQDEQ